MNASAALRFADCLGHRIREVIGIEQGLAGAKINIAIIEIKTSCLIAVPDGVTALTSMYKGFELDRVSVPGLRLTAMEEKIIGNGFTSPDVVSIDLEMINFLDDLPNFLRQLLASLLCMECVTESVNLRTLFSSQESKSLANTGYEPITLIGGNIFAVQKSRQSIKCLLAFHHIQSLNEVLS